MTTETPADQVAEVPELEFRMPRTAAGRDLPTHDQIRLPYELELLEPIAFGSETIDSITFRKFNLGVLDGLPADGLDFGHYTTVISRMTTEPLAKVRRLGGPDAARCLQIASGFLAPFRSV